MGLEVGLVRGSFCGGQSWITLSAAGSLIRVNEFLSAVSDLVIDIEIVHVFFKNLSSKGYFETCQNGLFLGELMSIFF